MFKAGRPTYAIILLSISSLWICAIFLPFLYSVAFPNKDIQEVVEALKQHGTAPPEATSAVGETMSAVGPLTRALPIAYYSGVTTTVSINGSKTVRKKQQSYVTWFQKRPKAFVLIITRYEDNDGRRAYEIGEGDPVSFVRGYTLPVLLFGVSLFLVRKRKPSAFTT